MYGIVSRWAICLSCGLTHKIRISLRTSGAGQLAGNGKTSLLIGLRVPISWRTTEKSVIKGRCHLLRQRNLRTLFPCKVKTTVNPLWHDICNLLCQETRRRQTTSSSHYSCGQKAYLESSMHWRGKISTLMHRNFVNLYWINTNFSHLKYDVSRWLIKVTHFYNSKKVQNSLDCL